MYFCLLYLMEICFFSRIYSYTSSDSYSFERAFLFLIIFTKLSQRGFDPTFFFLSIWNSSSIEQFHNLNISSQKHFRIYLELRYSLKEALSLKWKCIILTRRSFPECWSIKKGYPSSWFTFQKNHCRKAHSEVFLI